MRRAFNGVFDRLTPEQYYELARRIALMQRMRGAIQQKKRAGSDYLAPPGNKKTINL